MKKSLKHFLQLRKLKKDKEDILFQKTIWKQLKPIKLQENILKQEKREIQIEKNKIIFPSWSKLLLLLLFINFTILEIFIGWVTIQSFSLAYITGGNPDFTPLITLISLVLSQTISYGIYSAKSKVENTSGGIIYDLAIHNLDNQNQEEKEDAKG